MKYIKLFDTTANMNAAIANSTIGLLAMADNNGNPVVKIKKPSPVPPTPSHDYVDLGVVVNNKKILFATKNVGANTVTDYGNYYAWGETTTKNDYSWDTYTFNPSGDGSTFTKYNDTDGKTILEPSDDVVAVEWGGQWRSPTDVELEELLNQTTNALVTDYQGSGIKGRVFTGTNGNTMFVPAAGYRNGTSFYDVGSYAYWWSSSLDGVGSVSGHSLYFDSSDCYVSYDYRYDGYSVRGVMAVDA